MHPSSIVALGWLTECSAASLFAHIFEVSVFENYDNGPNPA